MTDGHCTCTANSLIIIHLHWYKVLTLIHVPPFRQGWSSQVIGVHEGNASQLLVCEQSDPHVPGVQITRYWNISVRELAPLKICVELNIAEGAAGRVISSIGVMPSICACCGAPVNGSWSTSTIAACKRSVSCVWSISLMIQMMYIHVLSQYMPS